MNVNVALQPIQRTREIAYRPDVDGLRAIAVMAVVFYHFSLGPFSSGFTGVDVFFVISGFLITQTLLADHERGEFSLLRFYERRFKRILPAMLVVLLASIVVGAVLLAPPDLESLGRSGVYSAFGFANIYFFLHTGYFDPSSDMQPLLHMWSLGVEEQFYLFWPLLMWRVFSQKGSTRSIVTMLISISAVSFAMSVYWASRNQPLAFYMLHTRAWELALGGLMCFAPQIQKQVTAQIAGLLGLALIAYGSVALDAASFPGAAALFPCIGAALIIWPKEHKTLASHALSIRPMVFIGLISYSLYLWHWPVLVFFRHYNFGMMPSGLEAVALIIAAVLLAYLSWKFVEPVRKIRIPRVQTLAGGAIGMACVAAMMAMLSFFDGFISRLPENVQQYVSADLLNRPMPEEVCRIAAIRDTTPPCLMRGGKRKVLVIGDSYATQYISALVERFPSAHFTSIGNHGCRPVKTSVGRPECVSLMKRAFQKYIPDAKFDAIILAARWTNGQADQIAQTVRILLTHTPAVYVVGPPMEYTVDLPTLLISDYLPRRKIDRESLYRYGRALRLEEKMKRDVGKTNAIYLSALSAMCRSADDCTQVTSDNIPIQHDYGHLTTAGAHFTLQRLIEQGLLDIQPTSVTSGAQEY